MVSSGNPSKTHARRATLALLVCLVALAVTGCQQVQGIRLGGINPLWKNPDADPLDFPMAQAPPEPWPGAPSSVELTLKQLSPPGDPPTMVKDVEVVEISGAPGSPIRESLTV